MDNDQSPSEKRFTELAEATLAAYDVISLMLAELPIPIRVPRVDRDWETLPAILALDRAREIISDQPIPEGTKNVIVLVLTDWFTAYELGGLIRIGGAVPWRIEALDLSVHRIAIGLEMVEELLSNEE
jgi:hypothetical protein